MNNILENKRLAILILTLNEERTLPISLGSVRRYLGNISVLVWDSYSYDNTKQVAEQMNAKVCERRFDGYASQRNAGLNALSQYEWVLMLDADEEITEEFAAELLQFVGTASETVTLARFRRRDFFMGRWIKRSSGYPTWFGRLVRPKAVRVAREINEEYVTEGEIAELNAHINHYPFTKGLNHWLEKHNSYSSKEANLILVSRMNNSYSKDIFSKNPMRRRAALKSLYMKLPLRPFFGFVYLYIVRLGFLDGRAGLQFCALRFLYELMIDLKVIEYRIDEQKR